MPSRRKRPSDVAFLHLPPSGGKGPAFEGIVSCADIWPGRFIRGHSQALVHKVRNQNICVIE